MVQSPLVTGIVIALIIPAIGIHEYCHAKFADLAGDPTPRSQGRVTLNLFNHFDPLGLMMIIITSISGFGIGWGRPVVVNPSLMHNPRWDHFVSVAAGPLSNLAQATLFALVFRAAGSQSELLALVCLLGVDLNLRLFLFNLIPLGPLDGHWLVGALLPDRARIQWLKFSQGIGTFVLLGIIFGGQIFNLPILSMIIGPGEAFLLKLLLGRSV